MWWEMGSGILTGDVMANLLLNPTVKDMKFVSFRRSYKNLRLTL